MLQKKKKEPKRKPKYGMLSCVGYIYRMFWKYDKGLVFVVVFTIPISLILSALGLYTPSWILSSLESSDRFSYVALVITGVMLATLIFNVVNGFISVNIQTIEHYMIYRFGYIKKSKKYDRDWFLQFDPEVQKMDERANQALYSNGTSGAHFPVYFSNMVTEILKFLLFGSVISLLNPVIIALLALGCFIDYLSLKWMREKNYNDRDVRNDLDKKLQYSTFGFSKDFRSAKDVRLYTMQDSLNERLKRLFKLRMNEQKKIEIRGIIASVVYFIVVLVRDGAAYAFLIYKASQGEVDASSFVLYFSAITSMSNLMRGISGKINNVRDGALQVSDFREAMGIPDRLNRGKGIPIPTSPFTIEFKNVSFKYPKGEKKVLDNVSFKIEAGEKIALVGLNGAGKTTLTLMMCGLLLPDEGEVLLDGQPLTAYNRDEMYSLFGVVPQDYHFLPISLARNIASAMTDDEIDREKLDRCIETAGLSEKIASLPKGVETPLNRQVNDDGIELSGGEAQKLLLARLLYKNPLCIILDEPTAALDPIAEDRMYRRYNEIAAHATSVFISHRLASTRFCDRIFLLDGAHFAEVGTHDELMALGGKYKELFDIQAKYYREASEGEGEEKNEE